MARENERKEQIMALIKCPHCGHAVADVSYKCPNCGAPLRRVGDTDIFGDWDTKDKGLEGRRASSKKHRAKNKRASDDTLIGADAEQYTEDQLQQMREDAKIRAQHEHAMKTDGFAQGYGAAAGYEHGRDDMDATRRYGVDENGTPYYDDSYYKAAYDRDLEDEEQEERKSKKQKRSKNTVKIKNKTKKEKGRGPLIAIIIILIILLLAGSAFAYYELKWKPDHAQTTEQSINNDSQSDPSAGSSSSSSSDSQSTTDKNSEVDNGNGTDSNNSDSTTTDQDGTDQGGTEDDGATGGQDVTDDSGQ